MRHPRRLLRNTHFLVGAALLASAAFAQTPSSTLLALSKDDHTVAVVGKKVRLYSCWRHPERSRSSGGARDLAPIAADRGFQ
jgi:hypothetical protein